MEDTIDIKALWAIFTMIKTVKYGSNMELKTGFNIDSEMIYNCLQKELYAQSIISMN